jgi:hypothetical protein
MWGFKSYSHFLHEVRQGPPSSPSDFIRKAYNSETVKKAATGMGELVGSDGGFLVPPTFSTKIFERVYNENNLLAKTDQYTARRQRDGVPAEQRVQPGDRLPVGRGAGVLGAGGLDRHGQRPDLRPTPPAAQQARLPRAA